MVKRALRYRWSCALLVALLVAISASCDPAYAHTKSRTTSSLAGHQVAGRSHHSKRRASTSSKAGRSSNKKKTPGPKEGPSPREISFGVIESMVAKYADQILGLLLTVLVALFHDTSYEYIQIADESERQDWSSISVSRLTIRRRFWGSVESLTARNYGRFSPGENATPESIGRATQLTRVATSTAIRETKNCINYSALVTSADPHKPGVGSHGEIYIQKSEDTNGRCGHGAYMNDAGLDSNNPYRREVLVFEAQAFTRALGIALDLTDKGSEWLSALVAKLMVDRLSWNTPG